MEATMSFDRGHALLIGIGSYAHAAHLNVPKTVADVQAVRATLARPEFCGYPDNQVTLLSNASATRTGVIAALDNLETRVGIDDTVLLFYAGHGAYSDEGYELTTHNSRFQHGKLVAGSGLRAAELTEKLRGIKAKRLLLIVNACHAGEVSPVLGAGDEPFTGVPLPNNTAAAVLGTGEGRIIITACRDGQVSYIGSGQLTLFTQALIDGLQGKGVSSNRGYISVFDLYTHLYFALDEAVPRQISAALRQKYHATQEPELTVLKGVGPFAVSRYRGATNLSTFEGSAAPPEGTAVREVNPAYAQAMLRQHQQSISGNAQVGAAVAGDVHGDVSVTQQDNRGQHGGINFGSGNNMGTITMGDVAGHDVIKTNVTHGDSIRIGDIRGSGIAIGAGGQREVQNTDNREGTFVSGDQFTMSGNFSGGVLTIKSTLSNVAQSIGTVPRGDAVTRAELQQLIEHLSTELQQVPSAQANDAVAVAELAQQAVEQATREQPNQTMLHISAEGLKQAAQNLAATLPAVLPIATRIAETLGKMM
jgi:DNA-directed RNA polymerase subunit H (RpoH/RPB5)